MIAARQLTALAETSVAIAITDGPRLTGTTDAAACTLRVTAFELLRFRLGRRTRGQALALDWTGDPEACIDSLFIFGPAAEPIVE